MAQFGLVPRVVPDPLVKARDEALRRVRPPQISQIDMPVPEAGHDHLLVVDPHLVVAAEAIDATGAGVTAGRQVRKAPRGAQK